MSEDMTVVEDDDREPAHEAPVISLAESRRRLRKAKASAGLAACWEALAAADGRRS